MQCNDFNKIGYSIIGYSIHPKLYLLTFWHEPMVTYFPFSTSNVLFWAPLEVEIVWILLQRLLWIKPNSLYRNATVELKLNPLFFAQMPFCYTILPQHVVNKKCNTINHIILCRLINQIKKIKIITLLIKISLRPLTWVFWQYCQ